jgi:predicted Zn-dependent protease with MMP-like domain
MTFGEFEELVRQAVVELPEEFAQALSNIEIVAEVWPTEEDLRGGRVGRGYHLFGQYRGVPHTLRANYNAALPDKIAIFAGPILSAYWPDLPAVRRQIKATVLHEIGHHFGMTEEQIRKAEQARDKHI